MEIHNKEINITTILNNLNQKLNNNTGLLPQHPNHITISQNPVSNSYGF
ncbi:hypothetical protein SAMN05443663_102394 [Flavobacterium defluvii]|uniref:Uncharacterized protein n=1 Tax=Flavobacterium defluvii TaxID=370979 RepID=A0A1M5IGM6_9FLAO|nr:hypothetical protein SAMN05443663_102394 [Flavobacterium defluvii]